MSESVQRSPETIKACCAALYASDWARLLLGETFHPGGLALTERLGQLLGLGPGDTVLDVAAGRGASAVHLARIFDCRVVGVDYSAANVEAAAVAAAEAGLEHLTTFVQGDAERLAVGDARFDAVICECAFCTFPNKSAAAREIARVLRPGGRLGLADLTRQGPLPEELSTLPAWIACVAEACSVDEYAAYLAEGFALRAIERHDEALLALVRDVRAKLLGIELVAKLQRRELPSAEVEQARALARSADAAVRAGRLGYAILLASRVAR